MEFAIAEDEVWFSVFDVLPEWEGISGDDFGREVKIALSESEELHVSWDAVERSVRARYRRESALVVDVFREYATVLTIERHPAGPVIAVECHAEGCRGRMCVHTQPHFALTDVFLRT